MKNDDEIMTLDDDTEVFSLDDDSSQNIEENIEKEPVFSGQSYDMNEESHNIDEPVTNSNLYQNNYNQDNTNVVSSDYNTVVNPVPVEPDYNETDMVGEQNYNQDSTNVVSTDYNTVVNPVPVEPDYNETDMVGEQNYNQDSTNVVSTDYNTVVNPVPVEPDYNESSIDNNSNSDGSILSSNMNSLNDSDNLSNNSDINNNKVIDDTVKNNLTFILVLGVILLVMVFLLPYISGYK